MEWCIKDLGEASRESPGAEQVDEMTDSPGSNAENGMRIRKPLARRPVMDNAEAKYWSGWGWGVA